MSKGWSFFNGPRRRTSISLPRSHDRINEALSHSSYTSSAASAYASSASTPANSANHTRRRSAHSSATLMPEYKSGAMNQGQRVRYLKTGGIIVFIVLILYFFAPRDGGGLSRSPLHGDGNTALEGAETKRCVKSYSKNKPLIQYALMIDAGSTGSRIHVYKFNNCGPTPELEDEVFAQTEKKEGGSGLSSYGADAEAAAKSLDVLLDVAVRSVPAGYQRCTPIAVKATAGLRKLDEQQKGASEAILNAVRARLETKYPFPVVSKDKGGVEVMDGKDEGVYAWITTNYLLGKIGGPDKTPTAAVLDLGGGSTQIVFEPTFKDSPHGGMPEKLAAGDHKYELSFGGRFFELYQHSYLGYGLMEARNNLHSAILTSIYQDRKNTAEANNQPESKDWLSKPILNPCIAPGMSRKVDVHLPAGHPLGTTVSVNMTGPAEGTPALCRGFAEKTLEKDAECKLAPCAFRGIHQPSFEKTFAREDVYLLSYFYERTQPLGMPESFSLKEMKDLTERVCRGEQGWDVFGTVEGAMAELMDRPEWCLDLNFMMALLHTGYGMPIDREVKIGKRIKGSELGWCLGASLPLLNQESGWQCRIKEIPG
ncbi:guanosine-diphosphatase [Westerdykella ornata]|uniref:guanosine-diphosphatase n=1 Tax=Westerdykella ornata TaxID=318751 RepID=A0A6A6JTP9_WESOR|nr:guanosine-diphosphatase [Westerdykella ornata]KAF2279981.1 guanosine-diphosphatase [Westerdykella ornata]